MITRIEFIVNPFTRSINMMCYSGKDVEYRSAYVDDFGEQSFKIQVFGQKAIIFLNYDTRLEMRCLKMDEDGMVLDEPIKIKVKIVTTNNDSIFI